MKVAVYIENGVTQLVLTPEGEWEGEVTKKLASDGEYDVTIKRGSTGGMEVRMVKKLSTAV